MTAALTKRQREAFDFIRGYIADNGISPTMGEINVGLGLRSRSGVLKLINRLVDRGAITKMDGRARSIAVVEGNDRPFFSVELRDYCRRANRPIIEVIEAALREYFAAHPIDTGERP